MLRLIWLMACLASAPADTPNDAAHAPAWQNDVVYQIFPRSFKDSNGDGIGDLRGILSEVDYLQQLGVNVVWLNPIYQSSHYDSGYDVSDYLSIDPIYGSLADWDALRDALHARGMRLMMDFVPNHSSDAHPWFMQEKRLKLLQVALQSLLQKSSAAAGERILNLLVDPPAVGEAAGSVLSADDVDAAANMPTVRAAAQLLAAFLAPTTPSDTAATATRLGYLSPQEQLSNLGRALVGCLHGGCPSLAQPFDDFYIWRAQPNNWNSLFRGPAWQVLENASQQPVGYYMTLFSAHQVDLNWRNPRLRRTMQHILQTWEARGVDGFRIDSVGTLSKDPTFQDDLQAAAGPDVIKGQLSFTNLPEVHRYLREMSRVLLPNVRSIAEVAFCPTQKSLSYAGLQRHEMNEVFVFDHISVDCDGSKFHTKPFDLRLFKSSIDTQQMFIHNQAWLGNYVENHDQLRIVSRFGEAHTYRKASAKVFGSLLFTLEGTPFIYQGQEIGMTDLPVETFQSIDDIDDIEAKIYYRAQIAQGADAKQVFAQVAKRNRDHVRSAMQWRNAPYAGFSNVASAVRVNANYVSINVAAAQRDRDSILHYYQKLSQLRHQHVSWVHGQFTDVLPQHRQVFAYLRRSAHETSLIVLNFSSLPQSLALPLELCRNFIGSAAVLSNQAASAVLQARLLLAPWEARIHVITTP